eukprot:6159960-Prymnesium_polylepis.2
MSPLAIASDSSAAWGLFDATPSRIAACASPTSPMNSATRQLITHVGTFAKLAAAMIAPTMSPLLSATTSWMVEPAAPIAICVSFLPRASKVDAMILFPPAARLPNC